MCEEVQADVPCALRIVGEDVNEFVNVVLDGIDARFHGIRFINDEDDVCAFFACHSLCVLGVNV